MINQLSQPKRENKAVTRILGASLLKRILRGLDKLGREDRYQRTLEEDVIHHDKEQVFRVHKISAIRNNKFSFTRQDQTEITKSYLPTIRSANLQHISNSMYTPDTISPGGNRGVGGP